MHGLIDCYAARPAGELFDSMTLAHFAVWHNTFSGSWDDNQSEPTSGHLPHFQLQNGMGLIAQRQCQECL